MKKMSFSYGHLRNVDQGASGIMLEFDFNREYGPEVINWLKIDGVECVDCTPATAVSLADSLNQRINKANASGSEYHSAFHGDAFNGTARGAEVIAASNAGLVIGQRICDKLEVLGFIDRHAYIDRRGLAEVQHTSMVANIIEPLFIDNASDIALYRSLGKRTFAKAIAEGIVGHAIAEPVAPATVISVRMPDGKQIYINLQNCLNANGFTDYYGRRLVIDGLPGANTLAACKKVTVYPGDQNLIVAWIQLFLGIKSDGWYGQKTLEAVIAYQVANSLETDGVIGPKTWRKLLGL